MIQDMSQVDVVKNHFEVPASNHSGQKLKKLFKKRFPQKNWYINFKKYFFLIQDMSEANVVKNHFEVSDSNHDGQLDSREWLGYMRENLHSLKRDKKSRILRQEFIFFNVLFVG